MAGKKRQVNYLNILWTGLLWLICCIPVVTVIASSMAAYNTVSEILKGSDESAAESFFSGFKRYLRRWILMLIPDTLLIAWLIYVLITLRNNGSEDTAYTLLLVIVGIVSAVFLAINLCLIACGGRFGDGALQLIKLSLFCTFSHPVRSAAAVVCAVLMAGTVYLCVPLIIIMPAALWYIQCLIWNGVLKYYSIGYEEEEEDDEEDDVPEEDIIEDNDEYKVIRIGKLIIRKRKKRSKAAFDDDDDYEDTAARPKNHGDRVVPKSEVDNAD